MRSQDQEFRELQKLLAVKRHEQPPPRFFHDFAEHVLSRLHTLEPSEPKTWWQRMGLDFDLKPALVCIWGIASCVALIYGIIASLLNVKTPEGPWPSPISGGFILLDPNGPSSMLRESTPQSPEPLYLHANGFGVD